MSNGEKGKKTESSGIVVDEVVVGSTVQHFVQDFISQAENGLNNKKYSPCSEKGSHIKIELNATEEKEVGGSLKAHIFSLGGKKADSNVQKMTIYAKKIDEAEEAEIKARIEKAKAEEAIAKKAKKAAERKLVVV